MVIKGSGLIGSINQNSQTMSMKTLMLSLFAGLIMLAAPAVLAADETTITGTMVCGKCTLHLTEACQNVVQVKEDGKTVNYYLEQNETSKSQHEAICHGDSEKVKVTGTVAEKDGKKVMTATKIDVLKE